MYGIDYELYEENEFDYNEDYKDYVVENFVVNQDGVKHVGWCGGHQNFRKT